MTNDYGITTGTPATLRSGSDSYPYVVSSVGKKVIYVRAVNHGPNKLVWPDQDFPVFLDQPYGDEVCLRKGKRGWVNGGSRYSIGSSVYYQDPSF